MNERRAAGLLIALVLVQLALLTAQIPDQRTGGSHLEGLALRVLAPLGRTITGAFDLAGMGFHNLRSQRQLLDENARLRREIAELERERARRHGLELDLRMLSSALDYQPPPEHDLRLADVVYIDHASWLRTLVVYAATTGRGRERLAVDSAVTTAEGLVGRVISVAGSYARVQMVTDRASSVGVMIERTRRQGLIRGAENGQLALDFIPLQADVRRGDRLITAGIDGIYPRGIPVGTVVDVSRSNEHNYRIRVAPAVDYGVLDQVFVLSGERLPSDSRERLQVESP